MSATSICFGLLILVFATLPLQRKRSLRPVTFSCRLFAFSIELSRASATGYTLSSPTRSSRFGASLPTFSEHASRFNFRRPAQAPLPWANWQGTVHHGLPRESFSLGAGDGQYLAFLGRTSPEKGLDQAIEIAKRAGMLLKIAAKIDRVDVPYFEEVIKPLLDHPLIELSVKLVIQRKIDFWVTQLPYSFPSIGASLLA